MSKYRTPLSRARGMGAAHHGASHWIAERVSSIALIPLVLWAVFAVIHLAPLSRGEALLWLTSPINAVLMVLTFLVSFWHMHSGLRVVIEDYIDSMVPRTVSLIANLFICVLAGGLAIFSILKIAFGGAL